MNPSRVVITGSLVLLLACKARRAERALAAGGVGAPDAAAAAAADASPSVDAGRTDAASLAPPAALYRSATGGFAVRFPDGKLPDVETATVAGRLSLHLFKVQYGSSGYIVSYDDAAKASKRSAAQILDSARESSVETVGGTIDSQTPFAVGPHEGVEWVVSATTSGIKLRERLRALVVEGRLYQLMVMSPTWAGASEAEEQFFDSFVLLNPGD